MANWKNMKAVTPTTEKDEPAYRERVRQLLLEVGVPAAAVTTVIAAVIAALSLLNPFGAIAALVGAPVAVLFFIAIGRRGDVPPDHVNTASDVRSGNAVANDRD